MCRMHGAAFWLSFLFASSILFASCVGIPAIEACDSIVLDMPHGGRRIMVEPDGSGTYSYGALPAFRVFGAGTFVFEELYNELRDTAERRPRDTAETYGTVQFINGRKSGGDLFFVYDRELLEGFLVTAFTNRMEPSEVWEIDAIRRLNEIWLAASETP